MKELHMQHATKSLSKLSVGLLLAGSLSALSLVSPSANAATLLLNISGDTTIANQGDRNFFNVNNYGGTTTLTVRNYMEGFALMRFDTSGISALNGATINSVTLNFTTSSATTLTNAPLRLAQLTASNSGWVEGTGNGGGSYAAGGATLNLANKTAGSGSAGSPSGTGTAWAGGGDFASYAGGGNFLGNAATVYNLGNISGTFSAGSAFNLTISNDVITNWLSNPTLALSGLTLVNGGAGNITLHSSEAANSAFYPTITVDYTPVPEPGTVSLFGLGFGALVTMYSRKRTKRVQIA